MRKWIHMGALAAGALALPALAASTAMKPGQWGYSIKTVMPNMPFPMPLISFKKCLA